MAAYEACLTVNTSVDQAFEAGLVVDTKKYRKTKINLWETRFPQQCFLVCLEL